MKKINLVLILSVLILSVYVLDANAYCGNASQQANACRTYRGGDDSRSNGRNGNVEKYRDKENRNVVNLRKPVAQNPNSGSSCH